MGDILFDSARHTVAQANIDAKRVTTKSGNEKRAAQSSLATFQQSLGNQRVMEGAGREANSVEENLARNLDAATYGSLSARVSAAEELGASATDAAAAGVGGSSIDAYNHTLQLHADMAEEQGNRTVDQQTIAAGQARGDAISNGVANMGNNAFETSLDTSQFVDDHKMSTLTKITSVAAAAAATYFGGPQAGQAVLQFTGAQQKARNGDFAGAERETGQALDNGMAGFKVYRAGADSTHAGRAWGADAFKKIGASLHI